LGQESVDCVSVHDDHKEADEAAIAHYSILGAC